MAGDANRRARRMLVVALVGCGAFGLQSLPTASAAKGTGSSVASASEGSDAATRRAQRAAAKAEGAPAPPSVEASAPPATSLHGRRGQPAPPPPASPAGLDSGAGAHKGDRTGAVTRAQRRGERREERRSATSTSTSTSTSGAKQAVVATGDESPAGQAEAFARKQKKGSGGGHKGKKEHKGKKAPQEEGSGTEGSDSEGSSGAASKAKDALASGDAARATAAAASLALPSVAPVVGTGPSSINSVPPAVKAGLGASANANRANARAARRVRKGASPATVAAALSTSPLLATQTSAAAASSGDSTHAGAKRSQRGSTQPALVTTFTKIVGVVPTPVRILIGALILLALLLGVRSLLSGVRTRRLVRQRGQLLEDVGLLQAALLPVPPARLGPVATSVAYRPADGPGAGGDFYDVFALEGGEIAVIVGDVSGHGREALPHTALLRFTVRAYLEAGLSPRRALQTAGNVLDRQLAGSFATVLAATYNPRERKLTYSSAGHPPPVVLGEHGCARALAPVTSCSAPPIGAGMPTGTRQTVVSIPGPARLCFHTDGVTEARVEGDLFGPERLAAALSGLRRDADAVALLDRVAEQSDARPDDMAACLLRVHDGHGVPAVALEQLELNGGLLADARVERFLLDCGVEPVEVESLVQAARRRLQRADRVVLELVPGVDGRMMASLVDDNVIHAAALAAAGAC